MCVCTCTCWYVWVCIRYFHMSYLNIASPQKKTISTTLVLNWLNNTFITYKIKLILLSPVMKYYQGKCSEKALQPLPTPTFSCIITQHQTDSRTMRDWNKDQMIGDISLSHILVLFYTAWWVYKGRTKNLEDDCERVMLKLGNLAFINFNVSY